MPDKKQASVVNMPVKTLELLSQLGEKYDLTRQQTLAVLLNKKMNEISGCDKIIVVWL